jgi:hypothetical protein
LEIIVEAEFFESEAGLVVFERGSKTTGAVRVGVSGVEDVVVMVPE